MHAPLGHRGLLRGAGAAALLAMDEGTGILPGLPPVAGKPVHSTFDGGRMSSDAGILSVAAVEQQLGDCPIKNELEADRPLSARARDGRPALRSGLPVT